MSSGTPPPDPSVQAAVVQPDPLRVLLVEDVPVQRKLLERMLQNMGHTVETAPDGERALAQILEGSFDVVITDWDMPAMDGPTLCTRIRGAKLERYIFIIFLTSHNSVPDFVAGLDAGADVYVRKPAEPFELGALLRVARRITHLERQLRAEKETHAWLRIYTRDRLDEYLPREIERARKYEAPLSLVVADLDHFKRINDQHGHAVGNEVLQEFCERARHSLGRPSDWIARYGGEEFVIVLPQTGVSGALHVAEKLRALCADSPVNTSGGPLAVTVSLGVSELMQDGEAGSSAARLLHRADQALYCSKGDGRNRVTIWDSARAGVVP